MVQRLQEVLFNVVVQRIFHVRHLLHRLAHFNESLSCKQELEKINEPNLCWHLDTYLCVYFAGCFARCLGKVASCNGQRKSSKVRAKVKRLALLITFENLRIIYLYRITCVILQRIFFLYLRIVRNNSTLLYFKKKKIARSI